MMNCKFLVLLALAGAASAGRLQDFVSSKAADQIPSGRHLLEECPEGFYAPAYGGDSNSPAYPPPPYPPSSSPSYPPPPGEGCEPCPAGFTSDGSAVGEDACTACTQGLTSSGLGGGCFEFTWPAMDPSFQRDAVIEFLGPDFAQFFSAGPSSVARFNQTVAQKLNDYSIASKVLMLSMKSGSIVTESRMDYTGGESSGDMDGDQQGIMNNLQTVFGDSLNEWGVNGFKGTCKGCSEDDDDNKALAIGLGVGLGLGVPLIAGIIFFCIWKKRRGEQVVAPQQS